MPVLRDTTPGAPVLSGTAGSLIAVLDYCLVTNSGWTKPYSGTNLASYQMPSGSTGHSLWVDDSGTQNARVRLFESMTSESAGTGPTPTDAQVSGGLFVYKSTAASVLSRPWTFVSRGNLAYLLIAPGGVANDYALYVFGDIISYRSPDNYACMIIANATASAVTTAICGLLAGATTALADGHYISRSYTQIGGSTQALKTAESVYSLSGFMAGTMTYPSPIDSGLHIKPMIVLEGGAGRRGILQGLWCPENPAASLATGDTFSGVTGSTLAGRAFEWFRLGGSYACCIEMSDTWSS